MLIRKRQPITDDATLIQLVKTELLPLATFTMNDAELHQDVTSRLRRGTTFVLSVTSNYPPLGFIHVMIYGKMMYIDMLAVHRSFQRQGYGASLLHTAEKYAIQSDCNQIKLLVDDSNTKALQFYKQQGYRATKHWQETYYYEMLKLL